MLIAGYNSGSFRRIRRPVAARWLKCTAGTFAVEFALITPILLLLAVAAGDLSLMIYRKMEIQNAAKLATQYGLIRRPIQGNVSAIETAAKSNLPADWFAPDSPAPAVVAATLTCSCGTGISAVACTVSCPDGTVRATYLNVQIVKTQPTIFDYPALPDKFVLTTNSSVRLQ